MPKTLRKLTCSCSKADWVVLMDMDGNLEKLVCVGCGRVAKITAVIAAEEQSPVQARG